MDSGPQHIVTHQPAPDATTSAPSSHNDGPRRPRRSVKPVARLDDIQTPPTVAAARVRPARSSGSTRRAAPAPSTQKYPRTGRRGAPQVSRVRDRRLACRLCRACAAADAAADDDDDDDGRAIPGTATRPTPAPDARARARARAPFVFRAPARPRVAPAPLSMSSHRPTDRPDLRCSLASCTRF